MGPRLALVAVALLGGLLSCGSTSEGTTAGGTTSGGTTSSGTTSSGTTSGATTSASPAGSVLVTGRVVYAPHCPNQPASGTGPCALNPVPKAAVRVQQAMGSQAVVASTATSQKGRFTLHLAPGRYTVTASLTSAGPHSTAQATVVVGQRPVHVRLVIDSGIR